MMGRVMRPAHQCVEATGSDRPKENVCQGSASNLYKINNLLTYKRIMRICQRFAHIQIVICLLHFLTNISSTSCAITHTDQPVSLTCTFDNPVTCAWTRRGFHVDIQQRYIYTGGHNGTNMSDCSIKIEKFKAIDAGQWMCKSMATSSAQASMGAAICLLHQVKIIKQPSASTVGTVGKLVVLDCIFDSEQRCLWLHNGSKISMGNQYNCNTSETKNCSLAIQSFEENDAGIWQCQNEGNETEVKVTSTEAYVSIMEKPSPPNIFEFILATTDERYITCISKRGNPPPNLYWVQRGTKQNSENRIMKYTDGNAYDVMISLRCSDIVLNSSLTLECVAEHESNNWKETIKVGNLSCLRDQLKEQAFQIGSDRVNLECPSNCCEVHVETSGISGGLIASIVINVVLAVALTASIVITVKSMTLRRRLQEQQARAALALMPKATEENEQ